MYTGWCVVAYFKPDKVEHCPLIFFSYITKALFRKHQLLEKFQEAPSMSSLSVVSTSLSYHVILAYRGGTVYSKLGTHFMNLIIILHSLLVSECFSFHLLLPSYLSLCLSLYPYQELLSSALSFWSAHIIRSHLLPLRNSRAMCVCVCVFRYASLAWPHIIVFIILHALACVCVCVMGTV